MQLSLSVNLGFAINKYFEPEVFEDLSEEENERFTQNFDAPAKQRFPRQWD